LNQNSFRKLISGQSSGLGAVLLRFFFGVAAQLYLIVIRLRNFLYDKGWLKTYQADAAVISIGNITAGGTGKTPLVIWLCKFLQQKEIRCAVLTRGYKTHTQTRAASHERRATIDEPAILKESCPEAEVVVNPDRLEGAAEAVTKFGAKALIMDDGFQHRRLVRDANIVAIDAMCPFGYGKILPAGLLREPVTALKRADAAVLTRCDQTNRSRLARLEEKLRSVNPDMIIAKSFHAPVCAKSKGDEEISIEGLRNKKIFAFCGIGNPDAFFGTIKQLGADLIGSKIYDDHYHYTRNDIADIYERAGYLQADLILTTQKDWAGIIVNSQLSILDAQGIPFAYLVIELKFLAGEDRLKQLIEDGVTVYYLAGNHDFALGPFLSETIGITLCPSHLDITLQGKNIHLYHGDGILKSDAGYRFWRSMLRNPINQKIYKWLHPNIGIPFARLFSGSSRHLQLKKYTKEKRTEYLKVAITYLEKGADIIIMAHTHYPEMYDIGGKIYCNVGEWLRQYTYARLKKGKLSLLQYLPSQTPVEIEPLPMEPL